MPAAQRPANEADRQRALESYRVFDMQADPVYDNIVRLAAELCETPIAVLSLVDRDRQWIFARHGLDIDETPSAHALCAHAMLDGPLTETPGARDDERFFDSPLVTGYPGIRFYAAVPITNREGLNLGALCVAAPEPGRLSPFQRSALNQLAHTVVLLLESRQAMCEQARQLRYLATHDELTALPNRVLGTDRLQTAVARAYRNGTTMALLFIDLDDFKMVNDSYGHAAGDVVLAEIGRRLIASTRETDTVTRWGGDEFLVILSDITHRDDAESKRAHLLEVLGSSSYPIGSSAVSVSASIGLAVYPDDGKDEPALLNHADMAMYQTKRARSGG
jgi:diguanylate cyclase (GGDEF)-like protein